MNARQLARADQIGAVLREIEEPVDSLLLYRWTTGPACDWSFRETLYLLNELRIEGRIEINPDACCFLHARWALPDDS